MSRGPEIKYAKSGDLHIAYQVVGSGFIDLVFVSPWVLPFEILWEEATVARFLERVASLARLVLFDKRGTGLSDRVSESELPMLFGASEGGPMSVLFAATYPERTAALILWDAFAKFVWSPDYPWSRT